LGYGISYFRLDFVNILAFLPKVWVELPLGVDEVVGVFEVLWDDDVVWEDDLNVLEMAGRGLIFSLGIGNFYFEVFYFVVFFKFGEPSCVGD
jgi:hypothetical protein